LKLKYDELLLSFAFYCNYLCRYIQVNFPSEEKRGANGVTFFYSPLIEYKIPVFRHPGAAMRTMVFPLLVTNLGTCMTLVMGSG